MLISFNFSLGNWRLQIFWPKDAARYRQVGSHLSIERNFSACKSNSQWAVSSFGQNTQWHGLHCTVKSRHEFLTLQSCPLREGASMNYDTTYLHWVWQLIYIVSFCWFQSVPSPPPIKVRWPIGLFFDFSTSQTNLISQANRHLSWHFKLTLPTFHTDAVTLHAVIWLVVTCTWRCNLVSRVHSLPRRAKVYECFTLFFTAFPQSVYSSK